MAMQTYRNKMRIAVLLGLGAALAAGAAGGWAVRLGGAGENFWLVYPALLAVSAVAFAALTPWWRRLDDMQRTGQLVSWWWGGMAGALVVMMALVAATGTRSDLALGSLYTVLGQAAGFLLFLAGWHLRRAGPAE